ncbi:hypothetical protein GCM10011494_26030 [Novosphingobium endophyticum]|uniref:SnoaL-like domain-containing protein n=1 Tax=Novosphingobium endophyticum TaxID=1955250 RepID=A0A916TW35_9SPHN|nr:nuclear transport factor 2 family protein [Novosphingobium endophyticum]GGC06182.1 hypothetical protein GCM10011494_26030 [Novosphingobium endophyticum]
MDTEQQAMRELLDREAMRCCLARLARGEDRRSAELIRTCWWPNARFDYGVHAGDFETYLAWVVPGTDAIKDTQHILGQSHIELAGNMARAETHVLSYHRVDMGSGDRDTCIGGRYLDTFERRGTEWRIIDRVLLYDFEQEWGEAADWSRGVMGYPFSDQHFPGRAKGDFSETWFEGNWFDGGKP